MLGCATYCSPSFRVTANICPLPTRASRPLPVTFEVPQLETVLRMFTDGVILNEFPVQANNALFCAIFQSSVPSRCNTAKEVSEDFVDMRALIGDVEVIF